MAKQNVPLLPQGRWVDGNGIATGPFRTFMEAVRTRIGGSVDKVDQAKTTADAAAPGTAEVVAGAGLINGGQIGFNATIGLYLIVTTVAKLPAAGNIAGRRAYATDGRNSGEGAWSGTGCEVIWNGPLARWVIPGQTAAITA